MRAVPQSPSRLKRARQLVVVQAGGVRERRLGQRRQQRPRRQRVGRAVLYERGPQRLGFLSLPGLLLAALALGRASGGNARGHIIQRDAAGIIADVHGRTSFRMIKSMI